MRMQGSTSRLDMDKKRQPRVEGISRQARLDRALNPDGILLAAGLRYFYSTTPHRYGSWAAAPGSRTEMPRFWIPAEFNRRKPLAVAFSKKVVLGWITCLELEFEIELELRTWVPWLCVQTSMQQVLQRNIRR